MLRRTAQHLSYELELATRVCVLRLSENVWDNTAAKGSCVLCAFQLLKIGKAAAIIPQTRVKDAPRTKCSAVDCRVWMHINVLDKPSTSEETTQWEREVQDVYLPSSPPKQHQGGQDTSKESQDVNLTKIAAIPSGPVYSKSSQMYPEAPGVQPTPSPHTFTSFTTSLTSHPIALIGVGQRDAFVERYVAWSG